MTCFSPSADAPTQHHDLIVKCTLCLADQTAFVRLAMMFRFFAGQGMFGCVI
jgi:hypothetical protein